MEEALASFQRAARLSPREMSSAFSVGETLGLLGRFDEAEHALAEARRLDPTNWVPPGVLSLTRLAAGDTEAARAFADSALELSTGSDWVVSYRYQADFVGRDYVSALRTAEAIGDSLALNDQYFLIPTSLFRGRALQALGRTEDARAAYRISAALLERWVEVAPEDERAWSALGLTYAGLDRDEDAVRAARRGAELLPIERELWRGAYRADDLARVYASVGRSEEAITILQTLLDRPVRTVVSPALLRMDPDWDPIREHPRFQALLDEPTEWTP